MKETLSTSEKEVPKHRNALEEKYQNTKGYVSTSAAFSLNSVGFCRVFCV